jgi:hypothetical protein
MHFKSRRKLHRIATAFCSIQLTTSVSGRSLTPAPKRLANACYLEKRSVRKRNCFILTSSFLANPVESLGQEKLSLRACYIT